MRHSFDGNLTLTGWPCGTGGAVRIHAAAVQGEARQRETEEAGGLHPPCHYEDPGSCLPHRQYPNRPQRHCCLSARRWPCLPLESWASATENQRHVCMFSLFFAAYLTEFFSCLYPTVFSCLFFIFLLSKRHVDFNGLFFPFIFIPIHDEWLKGNVDSSDTDEIWCKPHSAVVNILPSCKCAPLCSTYPWTYCLSYFQLSLSWTDCNTFFKVIISPRQTEGPSNRKSKWASDFTLMTEHDKLIIGTGY